MDEWLDRGRINGFLDGWINGLQVHFSGIHLSTRPSIQSPARGLLLLERHHADWRQSEFRRIRVAVPGFFLSQNTAEISHVAAAVNARVAIDRFAPFSRARQTNAITRPHHWSQIHH